LKHLNPENISLFCFDPPTSPDRRVIFLHGKKQKRPDPDTTGHGQANNDRVTKLQDHPRCL
jgi:hypothetical protein